MLTFPVSRFCLAEGVEIIDAPPDALLGVVADGAGVGHYDVGFGNFLGTLVAVTGQNGENDLGVVHVHLAAVCFDVKLFHDAKICKNYRIFVSCKK